MTLEEPTVGSFGHPNEPLLHIRVGKSQQPMEFFLLFIPCVSMAKHDSVSCCWFKLRESDPPVVYFRRI